MRKRKRGRGGGGGRGGGREGERERVKKKGRNRKGRFFTILWEVCLKPKIMTIKLVIALFIKKAALN